MIEPNHAPSTELSHAFVTFADGTTGNESNNGSADNESDACPNGNGTSTHDRTGCLDTDGDGYSDPDATWNISMGADAFPERADAWSDLDGDNFADQPNLDITDDCPTRFGKSRSVLYGCSDMKTIVFGCLRASVVRPRRSLLSLYLRRAPTPRYTQRRTSSTTSCGLATRARVSGVTTCPRS